MQNGCIVRAYCIALLLTVAALARAETQIVEATIEEVRERGFTLKVGTDALMADDGPSTKYWKGRKASERGAFKAGDQVTVRLKTDSDPPEVREIADRETWKWLEGLRKQPSRGIVEKIDAKYITLKLPDGATFPFRYTDKSLVTISGKANAKIGDLAPGAVVYVKPRTLPTLEVWIVELSDVKIEPKPGASKGKSSKAPKKAKTPALPASGRIEVEVLGHTAAIKMFDVILPPTRTLHITYTADTKFEMDGKKAGPAILGANLLAQISYRRDKYGRIVANRVELRRK